MVALRSLLLLLSLLFAPMKAFCRAKQSKKSRTIFVLKIPICTDNRHVMEYPARDTGRYFNICRGIKLFGSCNYVPLINGTRICICAIHMHSSRTMTIFKNVTQEIPLESFHIFWHLQINIWKKSFSSRHIDCIKFILLRHSDDINKENKTEFAPLFLWSNCICRGCDRKTEVNFKLDIVFESGIMIIRMCVMCIVFTAISLFVL